MTAVQKIIEQIDEEVQVLSNLYGSEIKGRLIALAFAKKRCLEVLELEKQQIIDAYWGGLNGSINDYSESKQVGSEIIDIKYGKGADQYYNETYGSKGSDETLKENHIVDTNEMVEDTFKVWECCGMENCICKGSDATSSQTDENGKPLTYWGGVDFTNKNAHLIKSNRTTSSQTEISDEEIKKWAKEYTCKEYDRLIFDYENYDTYNDFVNGAKKYREQLKSKQ